MTNLDLLRDRLVDIVREGKESDLNPNETVDLLLEDAALAELVEPLDAE